MNITTPVPVPTQRSVNLRGPFYVTGFQNRSPRFRTGQKELLHWLVESHTQSGGVDRHSLEALFARYSASADQIFYRGHELGDFTHHDWDKMRLFGPAGSNLAQKTQFFDECVKAVFDSYYPLGSKAPEHLVHVTCTGYTAPSGAQKLVSTRRWGRATQVVHAYHMGCYAAHPAIRIARGLSGSVDVVHTELCSLHLDPTQHNPAQLVIQSLFADGYMKYQVTAEEPESGFEILAARDEILADSAQAMNWTTGPLTFTMSLSKEVPTLFASALPRFTAALFEEAGLDWTKEKPKAIFAIHPGGPRIIELSQQILGLESPQVQWGRDVLREYGNMSSATLPHIWQRILADKNVPGGTLIASLGAGPGLTLSGMLFRKEA